MRLGWKAPEKTHPELVGSSMLDGGEVCSGVHLQLVYRVFKACDGREQIEEFWRYNRTANLLIDHPDMATGELL